MASFKLHLLRLAREGQVEVPGVPGLRAYTLRERVERPGPAFYLLLEGELVVDLPEGRYLHLRRGEAARVGPALRAGRHPGALAMSAPSARSLASMRS